MDKFLQRSSAPRSVAIPAQIREDLSSRSYIIRGYVPSELRPNWERLLKLRPAELGEVVMMGRPIATPRYTSNYIKPYQFTGKLHAAEPLPPILQPLLEWASSTLLPPQKDEGGQAMFNQALVNFYMDGAHYIGKHSDDERQLVPGSPVFSASFGQERTFRIRRRGTGEIVEDILMKDGTFIAMCGDMQKEFTHEVPKVAGKKGAMLQARVNVTFRLFS